VMQLLNNKAELMLLCYHLINGSTYAVCVMSRGRCRRTYQLFWKKMLFAIHITRKNSGSLEHKFPSKFRVFNFLNLEFLEFLNVFQWNELRLTKTGNSFYLSI